ncbi:MAG TPA: HYR domain-containing protein, partial [Dehalococcoidia bacterium]|nr:HYR domain-containing protein [Dehalococcoidia bacterium]
DLSDQVTCGSELEFDVTDGTYSFGDLIPGTYTVRIAADSLPPCSEACPAVEVAIECQENAAVDLGVSFDRTPPDLICPPDVVIDCPKPYLDDCGVLITPECNRHASFQASATDDCDEDPAIEYSHEPGSEFPEGETTVTVTATDRAGNVSRCTFTVTVHEHEEDPVQ